VQLLDDLRADAASLRELLAAVHDPVSDG